MSLRINTNVDALTAYNNLNKTQQSQSTSNERLSSGLRINKAADDAAGLAISQGLTKQINGLGQAIRNAQDGINMVQTADGALTETHSILQRMNTLAVQAANASNDDASRSDIQKEVGALNKELDRIASSTSFNGVNLLDGSFTNKKFQVGGTSGAADQISVDITSGGGAGAKASWANGAASVTTANSLQFSYGSTSVTVDATAQGVGYSIADGETDANKIAKALNHDAGFANSFSASVDSSGGLVVTAKAYDGSDADQKLGITNLGGTKTDTVGSTSTGGFSSTNLGTNTVDLTGAATSVTALDTIKDAIQNVSNARANLGALQNRFQHTINNLTVTQQNLQASNSSIQDTDMASEMSNFTRTQVLQNAGISMLAQANQSSQGILKLLG
jgi:flagellin